LAEATIPGGKSKGTPLSEAETSDIEYWYDRLTAENEESPGGKWAKRNAEWLAAADTEFQRRVGQAPEPKQEARTELAPRGDVGHRVVGA